MKIISYIESPKGETEVCVRVHVAETESQLLLHPNDFYKKHAEGKLPDCPHHELEVEVPGRTYFDKKPGRVELHTHKGAVGSIFVCYPYRIANPEKALEIFTIWSVGTIYMVETNTDFSTIFDGECAKDAAAFLKRMNELGYGHRGIPYIRTR